MSERTLLLRLLDQAFNRQACGAGSRVRSAGVLVEPGAIG